MLLHALKPELTTISPDRETVAAFDREGRLLHLFRAGRTYKRSLGSDVHLRERGEHGRERGVLGPAEARAVFADALEIAAGVARTAPPELRDRLESEVLPWTPERLEAEAERFRRAYAWPVSILPPDAYLNVVVQATFGCTWNKCTFCSFYQDREFRARGDAELAAHLDAVRDLLGRGRSLRRGVFLADGNALALGNARLERVFGQVRDAFGPEPVSGFVDVFTGERHAETDWAALRALGLSRVHIGLETGEDELLRFLNKPGSAADAAELVRRLKAAGVAVSLILMVGVGGAEWVERHRVASLEAIRAMRLGGADLVYLSPFVEHPGSVYAEHRAAAELTALSSAEVEAELAVFAAAVRGFGVKAARYDIREFLY